MKVYGIGGFSEVGRNMVVVDLGDDAIILDCGIFLSPIVESEEKVYTEKKLRAIGAVPSDKILDKLDLRKKVRAIIPSHAHLDHIGALPYLAHRYNCDIIGTPFTIEVLKSILNDEQVNLKNNLVKVQPNSSYFIKGKKRKYKVDFINITHSTIQCSVLAIHTPEGIVMYSNDFKLDDSPTFGQKPNYNKLKEISKEGVKVLIHDSLYSGDDRKTASEKVAKSMLEEVLLTTHNENNGLIVTTFSSHIARLKSIVEYGKLLNRKIIVLGRSMKKYITSAEKSDMCPFIRDIEIATYRNQLERALKKVSNNRKEYLVICTGHQGEPGSILDRLGRGKLPYRFNKEDNIVFSSSIIPAEANIENRAKLDSKLKKFGVRLFNNIHVSGHGAREDSRDFIKMVNPEHIIPAHGEREKTKPLAELAKQLGYNIKRKVHLIDNGGRIVV
jgi:ribonuclease J